MRAFESAESVVTNLQPDDIKKAYERVASFINHTPLQQSELLNEWLGHNIVFKPESLQKVGAFKARGALNKFLAYKEQHDDFPEHVCAYSAGNHSQAVAWAAQQFGVKATIFLPEDVSAIKKQATEGYGAEVIVPGDRRAALDAALEMGKKEAVYIHPFDDDDVICGQGTVLYEVLRDMDEKPDAVFASCGGGGLLSGSYLAKELLAPECKVFGVEPECANDAAESYKKGSIQCFDRSPETIADGVRSLHVGVRNFEYLKRLDGFYTVSEEQIIYWTRWISHMLKLVIEPSSSLAMGGAVQWLKTQKEPKTVVVILSGGNVSPEVQHQIWKKDCLSDVPSLGK